MASNGTKTATVESLTAEVRALMVGSRQSLAASQKVYDDMAALPLIVLAGLK